ncbi:uncharacterized protein [Aristolochia californica]|uniref:uncharacterized protein isoform X4 n=1 Tax=Aristolochia californica TaxID=171875 RepID=UPI0035DE8065
MLENPSDTVGRRYAPPSQRNRALNRKKSGDRFERINHSFGNEGGKSLVTSSSNIPVVDHGDAGWAVAMHAYNDTSIDQSERPAIYSGASSSAWGHSKLPHQFDFLAELRRSVRNANLSTTQGSADHS